MSNQYKFDETTGKWLESGAILSGVNSVNGLAGDVTYLPAGIVTTTTGDVSPPVYSKIYTGDAAPAVPKTGDIWIDSSYGSGTSNIIRWRKIAGGGETSLSGTDVLGTVLLYTPGYEQVYINGILQYRGSDYVATTGTTITGIAALAASDTIEVVAPAALQVGDYYTQAQADAKYALKTTVPAGAWQPYTPVWGSNGTQPAIVDGSISGAYTQIGKTVHYRLSMTIGLNSTLGTGTRYTFTLPVTGNWLYPMATGFYFDTSTNQWYSVWGRTTATAIDTMWVSPGPAGLTGGTLGAANPVVPAVGDIYFFNGTYEAA